VVAARAQRRDTELCRADVEVEDLAPHDGHHPGALMRGDNS
jgi:hypothetical protein